MASVSNTPLFNSNNPVSSISVATESSKTTKKTNSLAVGVFSEALPHFTQPQYLLAALRRCFELHKINYDLSESEENSLAAVFHETDNPFFDTLSQKLIYAVSQQYQIVIDSLDETKDAKLISDFKKDRECFHFKSLTANEGHNLKQFLSQIFPELSVESCKQFPIAIGVINNIFYSKLPPSLKDSVSMSEKIDLWKGLLKKSWYTEMSTQLFVEQVIEAAMLAESKEREKIKNGLSLTSSSLQIQPSVQSISSTVQNVYSSPEKEIAVLISVLRMHLDFYEKRTVEGLPVASEFITQTIKALCLFQEEMDKTNSPLAVKIREDLSKEMMRADQIGAIYKAKLQTECTKTIAVANSSAILDNAITYKQFCSYISLLSNVRACVEGIVNRGAHCMAKRFQENLTNYCLIVPKMKEQKSTEMVGKFEKILSSLVKDKKSFDQAVGEILSKPDEPQLLNKRAMLELYAEEMFVKTKPLEGLKQFQALQQEFSQKASDLYNSGETKKAQQMQNIYYELCMDLIPVFLCLHDIKNFREKTFSDESYIDGEFLDCFFLKIDVSEAGVESDLDSDEELRSIGLLELTESKELVKIEADPPKTPKQKGVSAPQKITIPPKDKNISDIHRGTKKRDLIKILCEEYDLVVSQGGSHTLLKTKSGQIVGVVPRGSKNLARGTFESIVKTVQKLQPS